MGIKGFSSFIDQHPLLLHDHLLRDTKVVIDGNNFYHMLYYRFSVEEQFGGDYDEFGNIVRWVMNLFKQCRIEPYVVFDGAYVPDDRKWNTTISRCDARLKQACSTFRGKPTRMVSILCKEVFIEILNECCVKYIQTDFEADDQIAVLANQLKCPVLSNDSDFYAFDIPAGFIPLDYVNFIVSELTKEEEVDFYRRKQTKYNIDEDDEINITRSDFSVDRSSDDLDKVTQHNSVDMDIPGLSQGQDVKLTRGKSKKRPFLTCQIYFSSNFIKYFNLYNHQQLSFLVSITGNDYIAYDKFEPFFATLRNQSGELYRSSRFHAVIYWLRGLHKPENLMEQFLVKFKQEERAEFEDVVQKSMLSYMNLQPRFDMVHLISSNTPKVKRGKNDVDTANCGSIVQDTALKTELRYKNGNKIPDWFIMDCRLAKIRAATLNVMTLNRHLVLCQVEDMREDSAHETSTSITTKLYQIVCAPDPGGSANVTQYDRKNENVHSFKLEIRFDDCNLPSVAQIPDMTKEESLGVLLYVLNIDGDVLNCFSLDLRFMAACLMYWIQNVRVCDYHVQAVLIGLLCTYMRQNHFKVGKKVKKDATRSQGIVEGCDEKFRETDDHLAKAMCGQDCGLPGGEVNIIGDIYLDVGQEKEVSVTDKGDGLMSDYDFSGGILMQRELVSEQTVNEKIENKELVSEELVYEEIHNDELIDKVIQNGELVSDELVHEEIHNEELIDKVIQNGELVSDELVHEEIHNEELIDKEIQYGELVSGQLLNHELMNDELVDEEIAEEDLIDHEAENEKLAEEVPMKEDKKSLHNENSDIDGHVKKKGRRRKKKSENNFSGNSEEDPAVILMNLISSHTVDLEDVFRGISSDILDKLDDEQRKYRVLRPVKKSNIRMVDISVIHRFAQLQAVILATIYLNQVLRCPLQMPKLSSYLNGTLIYRLCVALKTSRNVDLLIKNLLGGDSEVYHVYNSFFSLVTYVPLPTETSADRAEERTMYKTHCRRRNTRSSKNNHHPSNKQGKASKSNKTRTKKSAKKSSRK